jgi:ABC-2 type transport system ATP-binding protein
MDGIQVDNLTKTFRGGTVRALVNVSLEVKPGEAFGIIGPNGAGKTTFLGCLLGFLRPDTGRIRVDGRAPDDLAVRRVIGYLPERLVLDRWMSGRAFLEYHHALAGLPDETRRTQVDEALTRVGLEAEAAGRAVRSYSRGMLQRLGLAQALLGQPRYLYLDEPISGVDPAGIMLFRRVLADLKHSGVTLVFNSHQLDNVERLCDRVAFIKRGSVEAIETLHAGAEAARVLRVRAASVAEWPLTPESMGELALRAGAALLEWKPPQARFSVADDATAAQLLRMLCAAGVPVVEATPEESRLERLFASTEGAAPA